MRSGRAARISKFGHFVPGRARPGQAATTQRRNERLAPEHCAAARCGIVDSSIRRFVDRVVLYEHESCGAWTAACRLVGSSLAVSKSHSLGASSLQFALTNQRSRPLGTKSANPDAALHESIHPNRLNTCKGKLLTHAAPRRPSAVQYRSTDVRCRAKSKEQKRIVLLCRLTKLCAMHRSDCSKRTPRRAHRSLS